MDKQLYKVSDIAKMFSMRPQMVRQFCHAKGQKFAYQPIKNGNFYIDPEKFKRFLEWRTMT